MFALQCQKKFQVVQSVTALFVLRGRGRAGAEANNPKDPSPDAGQVRPKDQDPRQASSKPESRQDAEAAKRQQLCNQQRALLERLKQSPPSFTLNEKGERIPLDNSAAVARQEKFAAEQCRL